MTQHTAKNLRDVVLEQAARTPARTRSVRRRLGWLLMLCGAGAALGLLLMPGILDAAWARPTQYIVVVVACSLLVALVSSVCTIGSSVASPLPTTGQRLRSVAMFTPVALGLSTLGANAIAPDTWAWPAPQVVKHAVCLSMALLLCVVLLALASVWFRRSDPWFPQARGASAGAAAGSWVSSVIAIRCTESDPLHVLVTHVTPVVLMVVLGAWLGAKHFGFRYRAS